MKKPTDPVVIRVWKTDPRDIFALLPAHPADRFGRKCASYQHLGQHGIADYDHCIRQSRPATAEEAAELLGELRRIGYNPRVFRRQTPALRNIRRKAAIAD